MADDNIKISVEVDTGNSPAELDKLADMTRDAGEAVDELDAKEVSIDVEVNADAASDEVRRVGTEADGSRNALENMAGNTAQELGEIAGVGGATGQALGQIAEQAAAGKVSMTGLAATAGPIAALGLVMWGLEQRAKRAAERLEQTKESTEALSRVADDQVIAEFSNAVLNAAISGQSMDDIFKQMATDNLPGFKRSLDLVQSSGLASTEQLDKMRAAIAEVEAEMAQQERTSDQYGTNLDDTTDAVADLADELPTLLEPLAGVEGAMAGATKATQNLDDATSGLLGRIDDRQAWLSAQDAIEDYVRSMGDSEASTRDQERAWLNAADSLLRYVDGLENVPPEVKSEVVTAINEGDLGEAYRILDELTATRTVTINVATGTISGALAGIGAGIVRSPRPGDSFTPAAANVTNYYASLTPTEIVRRQNAFNRVNGID